MLLELETVCRCGGNCWKLGGITEEQVEFRCFYCGTTRFILRKEEA